MSKEPVNNEGRVISVKDKRKFDFATGLPVSDKSRKHADIPYDYVQMIIEESRKNKVNPYTALAIGLQETGYSKEHINNPFMMGNFDPYSSIIKQSVKFMAEKEKYAKGLGKENEEDIIQAWNGYGKVANKGTMYGIDTNSTPIDMNENPIYGKKIINLRDSVIMKNPEIRNLVEGKTPIKYYKKGGVVQKLKCGGKAKKMAEGGDVIPETEKTGLSGLLSKNKGLSVLSSVGADAITGVLDEKQNDIISNVDPREDPSGAMKNANAVGGAKSIVSGAAKGAMFGPWGALAGAAISGIAFALGSKKRKEEQAEATENWSNSWSSKTAANMQTSGYKKGGKIEGKGTGTSDSIPMKAPAGSFVVPAENAEIGEELGASFLGWNKKERAAKNNGGTDIKVSNGEVIFTPEEVSVLKYHGVDLDSLAPKAENKIEMKKGGKVKGYATAGEVQGEPTSEWVHDKDQDLVINEKTKTAYDKSGAEYIFSQPLDDNGNPTGEGKYVKLKSGSPYGIDIYSQGTKKQSGSSEESKWMRNIPEFAGALQAAGGAYGLIQAGKTPDMTVSSTLNKLSGEVRRLAEFGYDPAVMNALNTEIENTRRSLSQGIEAEGSNSALEKMAKLNSLLSTTIDKKAGLAFANAAEKSRKWADVMKVDTMKAGQEFDINKIKLDDWYKNQEVFAGMVTAGISNIVGSRQLKTEQDTLKQIGGNKPTWSKP